MSFSKVIPSEVVSQLLFDWGWSNAADAPSWLFAQAKEIVGLHEESVGLEQLLVVDGVLSIADLNSALENKPAESHLSAWLLESYPKNQLLSNSINRLEARTSAFKVPYFEDVAFEELDLHKSMLTDVELLKECEDIQGVVMSYEGGCPVLVLSSVDGLRSHRYQSLGNYYSSQLSTVFGDNVRYALADGGNIFRMRDVAKGETESKYSDGYFEVFESVLSGSDVESHRKLAQILNWCMDNNCSDLHFTPSLKNNDQVVRARSLTMLYDLPQQFQINLEQFNVIRDYLNQQSDAVPDGSTIFEPVDGNAVTYIRKSGSKIRLRLSFIPAGVDSRTTDYLVNIVSRILPFEAEVKRLEQIGLDVEALRWINEAINARGKMSLMVGPMGSGKSTTMYAMLRHFIDVNQGRKNVTSIEDPIEQYIDGCNQLQISPKCKSQGLGYGHYMKHIVRQDVNCLFLGEIRSSETALAATDFSALGNKLLATLHGDDEIDGLQRCVKMMDSEDGVYLLAKNLKFVFTQRLIPTLCPNCYHSKIVVTEEMQNKVDRWLEAGFYEKVKLPKYVADANPEGCASCGYRGFIDVVPVVGVLEVDSAVRNILLGGEGNKLEEIAKLRKLSMTAVIEQMVIENSVSWRSFNL